MCLVFVACDAHPDYPLIVVGNRDEFHHRPTGAVHWWPDRDILAGRDAQGGGTWLGVTGAGRFATVTNYREPEVARPDARSRGHLVTSALEAADDTAFGDNLAESAEEYSGFNLVWGAAGNVRYTSNRGEGPQQLAAGLHGLSNGLLDTPWPKVVRIREALERILRVGSPLTTGSLLEPFMDTRQADWSLLPDTGVPRDWEQLLSSPFIISPEYGTRASTAFLHRADGWLEFRERTFDQRGACCGDRWFAWPGRAVDSTSSGSD